MYESVKSDAISGIEVAKVTAPEDIRAADGAAYTTNFSAIGVGGTQIQFTYDTMPGNQPVTYGNTVFMWQTTSSSIPTGVAPINTFSVTPNQPNGSSTFPAQVGLVSYLLGYATGPNVKNVCATVFIPVSGANDNQSPSVSNAGYGPTSVTYNYSVPGGTQPQSDGDWVGIWEGQGVAVLYAVPPKAFAQVPQNSSSGQGFINNVQLLRNTQYTLGYFKGGYAASRPSQSTLACSYSFNT
jgi:hypothetical protein